LLQWRLGPYKDVIVHNDSSALGHEPCWVPCYSPPPSVWSRLRFRLVVKVILIAFSAKMFCERINEGAQFRGNAAAWWINDVHFTLGSSVVGKKVHQATGIHLSS
jgi:hypothetical protein